ncbi:GNAT family N-acetyltransferase [Bacillus thuringiensis]|uniref:N-acetyltransferase n=1 Tax=Bacillus thuringiensis TaxID=1428 RepID=A0A9X6ZR91_BACTU|nr:MULTISPECIES: GNAT family N-acetyltransferase [Bacillus]HDR8066258.1 GNAT family N-acetyltransferase [Bacillus cereus]MCC6081311.1 GNAT family N-acetyltransferase [Bacillus thuringiensis]MED3351356.1 GNAT family N-acetyltransferase [Bacillus thuringiensis]MRB09916.1 GNAT family N-acetyltransferase [Bacillus thuringiensis]OTW77500.1 GNAT family N-acetyltransferase [Bacillus thuringiensis serovar sumiyoshiensis]
MERNLSKEYTIRIATENESDSIKTLLKEVAQWLQYKEVDQWQYLLGEEATAEILECIRENYTYVVMKEDEIVGTVTTSPKQNEWDEHIFGKEEVSNSLYIHRFAVKRKYKGNRIGEWILWWVEENVQHDKEYLKLDCVGHNHTLNDFYKKNGFEYVGSTDGLSKFQKKRRM